jgi:hypothetical protein
MMMNQILTLHNTKSIGKNQNKYKKFCLEYEYEGWATKSGPRTATFNDLLCFPFGLTLY